MAPIGAPSLHVLRARRTAAASRATLALVAIVLIVGWSALTTHPAQLIAGFLIVLVTSIFQWVIPSPYWLKVEESLSPAAGVLIVGLNGERVNILAFLWLAAVASGVLARGGRQHWLGRAGLLSALALPIVLKPGLTPSYAAFCIAAVALLLTCGRVTRELRALLDRARWDADHDGLTGALSRTAFRSHLDAIASTAPVDDCVLLLIDLDNFGAVNKASGHAAGDAVLVSVVKRLRHQVSTIGVIGRLGGDEFAALVRCTDPPALARLVIADLARENGQDAAVAVSVGIAVMPRDGHDAETVLRAGDIALRVAKQSGKHQLSQYAGDSLSDPGPRGAQAALRRLVNGDGLCIVVQPIVDAAGVQTHAFEALARFRTRGTSSPRHWFAVADEFGMRDELELACLRQALTLFGHRPPETLLSVNLTGALLTDSRTHAILRSRPTIAGLIIEVTENSLARDTPELHAAISELIAEGVRFAVDDVGSGYSGLRQMTIIRPTYLKLDRSLVKDIDQDPGRCALLSALAGYAAQTGAYIIAEGVETHAELSTLRSLAIPLVQGFYLARPGPPWPVPTSLDDARLTTTTPHDITPETVRAPVTRLNLP